MKNFKNKIKLLLSLPLAMLIFVFIAPFAYASTFANVTASGNVVSLVTDSSDSTYCLSATGAGGYYLLSLRKFGVATYQGTPVLNTGAGQTLSITLADGNYYQTRIDCTDGPSHNSVEDVKLLGTTNQANTEFTLPVTPPPTTTPLHDSQVSLVSTAGSTFNTNALTMLKVGVLAVMPVFLIFFFARFLWRKLHTAVEPSPSFHRTVNIEGVHTKKFKDGTERTEVDY